MSPQIAVLGGTSVVGQCLLSLLRQNNRKNFAYSRRAVHKSTEDTIWRVWPTTTGTPADPQDIIPFWICLAPIWALPEYFHLLETTGIKRLVALSSTSRFTKHGSVESKDQLIASRLAQAESDIQKWAENLGIEWVILRPTLIYGLGRDKNISEICKLIRRFRLFPLLGKAAGLRQPVHAQDVAIACVAALQAPAAANHSYNISGGEVLTYREMIRRIFIGLDKRPRLLTVPIAAFQLAILGLRLVPRYRTWTTAMAERMNVDMVFDHSDAARDFGFSPRPFTLLSEDLGL
jgi:nucleoside-diphosphate-sugar epimerase